MEVPCTPRNAPGIDDGYPCLRPRASLPRPILQPGAWRYGKLARQDSCLNAQALPNTRRLVATDISRQVELDGKQPYRN